MSNSYLSISMITKEALRILKNNLVFAKSINRQYDDQFAKTGAKIGQTLNIRKPVRMTVASGPALQMQDITDQFVPVTLSNQKHVDFQFSSKDMALNVDDFGNRYLAPAMAALANQIDYDGMALYSGVSNLVGTPGTTPASSTVFLAAGQKLDELGAPRDGMRTVCINPAAQAQTVDALKGLFQSSDKIAEQYEQGVMGKSLGFTFKMDQNVQSQTVGALGGTPVVNGANQTGSSLITNGWTASAAQRLNVGDVFTIAGVNAVNPQNRSTTGSLQQFVCTAAGSSDGSGNMTISISPAITPSGQYQNVSASPANSAALTIVGTANLSYPQNLAFHRDAFVLACADLELPQSVEHAARATDPASGLSIRIVKNYDINTDNFPCRIDVLYGYASVYPELACRITG